MKLGFQKSNKYICEATTEPPIGGEFIDCPDFSGNTNKNKKIMSKHQGL